MYTQYLLWLRLKGVRVSGKIEHKSEWVYSKLLASLERKPRWGSSYWLDRMLTERVVREEEYTTAIAVDATAGGGAWNKAFSLQCTFAHTQSS